jgi:asparagine synthase (glutamine-hydrolysing)
VYRLAPGHKAIVTPAGLRIDEYWKPAPGPDLGTMSDDDYKQGFLEVFTKAVESRLRAPSGTAGSMLSGGMDSGSIVAVAKELLAARPDGPLNTFSAVSYLDLGGPDKTGCAESHAIHAAVSARSISATLIHPDAPDDIMEQLNSGNEEPFDGECMILKAIYLAARGQGMRVVLDGAGGDILLAEGSYILRLIRQRHFTQAMTEIIAEHRYWDEGLLASRLIHYARAAIVPEALKKVLRGPRRRHRTRGYLTESLIAPDLALSIDIENRFERMRRIFPGGWEHDYAVERCNAIWPNVTAGRERYARIAAATGTEARDPFLDKRVVEYCSRLPGRFRLRNGWPKIILREIMADKLPHEVLWARRKPHLGSLFNDAVTKQALQRGNLDLVDLDKGLMGYVDPVALAAAWKSFREGVDGERIHTAHVLSVWLKESANRPVVPE